MFTLFVNAYAVYTSNSYSDTVLVKNQLDKTFINVHKLWYIGKSKDYVISCLNVLLKNLDIKNPFTVENIQDYQQFVITFSNS